MAAAAIPVAMLAGSIGSSLIGKKASENVAAAGQEQTPEEKAAFQGGMGQAGQLGNIGSQLYGQGGINLGASTNYLQALLGRGGKESMFAATAPAAENIADVYRGHSRGIEARNVRGGVRDLALAEAERDKAGHIARLTAGVQGGAARDLANIGMFQTGAGVGATGQSGGLFSGLLGSSVAGRGLGLQGALAGHQVGAGYGQDIGSMLFRLLQSRASGGGGGGVAGGVPPGLPPGYPKGAGLPKHPGDLPGG